MNSKFSTRLWHFVANSLAVVAFSSTDPASSTTQRTANFLQAQAVTNSQLLPFFDRIDNPVPVAFPVGQNTDISPPPPQLNPFDRVVLKICGPVGTSVTPKDFRRLLTYYPDVLQKLKQVTGGELRPNRRSDAQFLEDLTSIWFKEQGFEHIFCGEIYNPRDIGGLHFYGRYLQFQAQGIGGRLPNNSGKQEVVPGVIYTMGVLLKQGDRTVTDVIKGYSYVTNAQEMLLLTTEAFKVQGNQEGACIFPVTDQEANVSYQAVFVRKNQAIITFYPDATPKGNSCKQKSRNN